jgi:hypothetical protein
VAEIIPGPDLAAPLWDIWDEIEEQAEAEYVKDPKQI